MSTMLVWLLMISPFDGRTSYTFSPPVATIQDCQRMQQFIKETSGRSSQCVQVKMPNNYNHQEVMR